MDSKYEEMFMLLCWIETKIKTLKQTNIMYPVYNILSNCFVSRKQWWFYVIKCQGVYKIGITTNRSNRVAWYRTENPFPKQVIILVYQAGYTLLERHLINQFQQKVVYWKEWLSLSNEDLIYIKRCCLWSNLASVEEDAHEYCYLWLRTIFDEDRDYTSYQWGIQRKYNELGRQRWWNSIDNYLMSKSSDLPF
jgi:hypothetical protein